MNKEYFTTSTVGRVFVAIRWTESILSGVAIGSEN